MKFEMKTEGDTKTFQVIGSLKGVYAVKLSKALEDLQRSTCKNIIIDLSRVEYIDSGGLGGLIYAQILLKKHNKQIILSAPHKCIKKLFRDCHFEEIFQIIEPE